MSSTMSYRPPMPSAPREGGGFVMTDLGMIFVLFLAVMFCMDPFLLYIDKRSVFKHFHLLFALGFCVLSWFGTRIWRRRAEETSVLAICWPLLLLALWIIGGALFARFHSKIVETFLIMGAYMLVTLGAARFIADHRNPERLLNIYLGLLFGSLVLGAAWQAGYLRVWSKFHEMEALTVPLAVYFYARAKTPVGRLGALLLLLLLMLLVIKNTSFMVAAIALAYVWWVFIWPRLARKDGVKRLLHLYSILLCMLLVLGAYAGIKMMQPNALPDGNPKYRLFTYERTWADFVQSPIWGKSFSGAGAETFGLFQVGSSTQVLPSHSDLLDILGQGGLLGMALFLLAIWRILRFTMTHFRNRPPQTLSPGMIAHFHWLAVSSISAIPVVAFNPIMLQPGKAFILWMNIGILVGIAIRCKEQRESKRVA